MKKLLKFLYCVGAFLVFSSFFLVSISFAEEAKEQIPIVVNGDRVEYFHGENRVAASGSVSITYKTAVLTCDRITVQTDTKEAIAEGNVTLKQDSSVFTGERVSYNFGTQKGSVLNGTAQSPPWYGGSEDIERESEKEYKINRGYVTTCDRDKPHYRIQAKQIRILPDTRVEAKHVVFYVGNVPIMYLPFYVQPVADKRMHVTIVPGRNKAWGTFTLTKWRYSLDENTKGYIHADYRERKGPAEGVDYKYSHPQMGSGLLRAYYMDERDELLHTERERWRVQYRHKYTLMPDTTIVGEYHEMSDSKFIKDYFYREEFEQENQPDSYAYLAQAKSNYVMSLLAKKRPTRFFTVVERLPEFKIDIKSTKIGASSLYYKGDATASNLTKKYADNSAEDLDAVRVDNYNELFYSAKIFDLFKVRPYAGVRQTYYSKDKEGTENEIRGALYSGADLSIKYFKTYNWEGDFLNLYEHKVRHVLTPSVRYNFIHEPTVLKENLQLFDDIDSLAKKNAVTLTLENKFQGKRKAAKDEVNSVDLARLIVTTDYLIHNEEGSTFSNVKGDLELRPFSWMSVDSDASFNTKSKAFDIFNLDFASHGPEERWRLGAGYRYEKTASQQLTGEAACEITPKWMVRAYQRYEFKTQELVEQEYAVTRDLHCWLMDFVYNKRDVNTFWVIFRLKAFPGAPVKFSTTYHGSRPGPQSIF